MLLLWFYSRSASNRIRSHPQINEDLGRLGSGAEALDGLGDDDGENDGPGNDRERRFPGGGIIVHIAEGESEHILDPLL